MQLGLSYALIAAVASALPDWGRGGGPPQMMAIAYRHNNCDNFDDFEDCRGDVVSGRLNSRRFDTCIDDAWNDMMDECDGMKACERRADRRWL